MNKIFLGLLIFGSLTLLTNRTAQAAEAKDPWYYEVIALFVKPTNGVKLPQMNRTLRSLVQLPSQEDRCQTQVSVSEMSSVYYEEKENTYQGYVTILSKCKSEILDLAKKILKDERFYRVDRHWTAARLVEDSHINIKDTFNLDPNEKFLKLEENFKKSSASLDFSEVEGEHLGRCFSAQSDSPRGSLLLSRSTETEIGSGGGPLFPSTIKTINQMSFVARSLRIGSTIFDRPAETNDVRGSDGDYEVRKFWKSAGLEKYIVNQDTSTQLSSEDHAQAFTLRKGEDGNLYGTIRSLYSSQPDFYCYFWTRW